MNMLGVGCRNLFFFCYKEEGEKRGKVAGKCWFYDVLWNFW